MPESEREHSLAAIRQHCQDGVLTPLRQQRVGKDGRVVPVPLVSALVNGAGETYAIATTERGLAA